MRTKILFFTLTSAMTLCSKPQPHPPDWWRARHCEQVIIVEVEKWSWVKGSNFHTQDIAECRIVEVIKGKNILQKIEIYRKWILTESNCDPRARPHLGVLTPHREHERAIVFIDDVEGKACNVLWGHFGWIPFSAANLDLIRSGLSGADPVILFENMHDRN